MGKLKNALSGLFEYDTDWSLLRNMHDRRI